MVGYLLFCGYVIFHFFMDIFFENGVPVWNQGILDYLTGSSVDARILRDNFVFKIVPMLNPDGVIVGNYRCSLAGQDLNRLWDEPSRKMHPTIFFTKSMFRHLLDDREVILFVDIHGHSRKKNVPGRFVDIPWHSIFLYFWWVSPIPNDYLVSNILEPSTDLRIHSISLYIYMSFRFQHFFQPWSSVIRSLCMATVKAMACERPGFAESIFFLIIFDFPNGKSTNLVFFLFGESVFSHFFLGFPRWRKFQGENLSGPPVSQLGLLQLRRLLLQDPEE